MFRFRLIQVISLIFILAVQVAAQGEPSSDPALRDYHQLLRFRDLYYPLLYKHLPAREYEILLNAAPVLETAAKEYGQMEYKTHHASKRKAYVSYRDSLMVLVKGYVDAALQFDTATACGLLPQMKDQFEQSARNLIPYSWPEFSRLRAVADEFSSSFTTKSSKKAQGSKIDPVRAADTIAVRMATFVASAGPEEVQLKASLIAEEKAYFTNLVEQIKTLAPTSNRDKLRLKATELATRLRTFERFYLQ